MTTIIITYDDREVRAALDRLARAVGDLSPAMKDIGELMAERTKQRFADGKGPDGAPWEANKPSTLEVYASKYGKKQRPVIVPS